MHWFARAFLISALGVVFGDSLLSGSVVINEIHHSPDVKQERVEFIELFNRGPAAADLTGWHFDDGITFSFPSGTRMEPGQFLVVAGDPAAVAAKFRASGVLGPWIGKLSGDGERVRLRTAAGQVEDEVEYRLGFPWPTVGDSPGYSMELIHPDFDNDLGGTWRSSELGHESVGPALLLPAGSRWRYWKGTLAPSSPMTQWRNPGFNDSAWSEGASPIGYDPDVAVRTRLDDMRGGYTQFFLRGEFDATGSDDITALRFEALFDDGFKMWVNGTQVFSTAMPPGEVAVGATASGEARENNSYQRFETSIPPGVLREGRNVVAVQVANINRDTSSDAFFDARLFGLVGSTGRGPSPGRTNVVYATQAPPAVRQVEHQPEQPRSGDPVTISARVTDPEGVQSVRLEYQVVTPGNYIDLEDPAYKTDWTSVVMQRGMLDTNRFTAELPPSVVHHRNLIRYRILCRDGLGGEGRSPQADDPQPNFALFCHDGVPAWNGAVRPGSTGAAGALFTVSTNEMNRLPVYHLISKKKSVEDSTWLDRSHGDEYFWTGALVYDGEVYDHIRFRPRGGVWRYAMGKNMWKFDFNRGHDFRARDIWGRRFNTSWSKLNLGACIQQGDTNHRGEQGMFESVGFRLFQLLGVPASHSTFVQFRVIDEAEESPADSQYSGDFWGTYLAIEQLDGRFLDEHGLPDGNLYKMEGGFGEPNNLGPDGPVDSSDLGLFLNAYNAPDNAQLPDDWWRTHLNLEAYYNYQIIVQGIHHYDIADGKNYFYYHHPLDHRWMVVPWDLDLTWANNMYRSGQTGGDEPFKSRVLSNFRAVPARPALALEFRNRVREVRDLLWNEDEAGRLIDEEALRLRGTEPLTLLDADRAQWDYNPIMIDQNIVDLGKAGQGRFYQFPTGSGVTRNFMGAVQLMKNYVKYRANNATFSLDTLSKEPLQPGQPQLEFIGPAGFPLNRLSFRATDYQGSAPFRSVKWRVGEISRVGHPGYDPSEPMAYEIQPVWESPELTSPAVEMTLPLAPLKVGHLYRARVRYTDAEGRTSHWSPPVEFTAGEPEGSGVLTRDLRLTELMYNPPSEGFEFIELHNGNPIDPLRLDGAHFSEGISYPFPTNSILPPGAYALVIRTTNTAAFLSWHGLPAGTLLFGPYDGSLDNGGEPLALQTAADGAEIFRVVYDDAPPWPTGADGDGYSLVPRLGGVEDLSAPEHWRRSSNLRGSPGYPDPEPAPQIASYRLVPGGLEVHFTASTGLTWVAETAGSLGEWQPMATNRGPATILLPVTGAQAAQFVRGIVRE